MEVTAAIIRNKQNEILICQRPIQKNCALLWEFPGGKQEPEETLEGCLTRECQEELNITIAIEDLFGETFSDHPKGTIHIHFFNCTIQHGSVTANEHNDCKWVRTEELKEYEFCPADKIIADNIANEGGRQNS